VTHQPKTDFDTVPQVYDIAVTQRETFTYSLPSSKPTTVVNALVRFLDMSTFDDVPGVASLVGVPLGKTATILVDAATLERDHDYELLVTLIESNSDTEPMRTIFACKA
jgi:hypothetical protein